MTTRVDNMVTVIFKSLSSMLDECKSRKEKFMLLQTLKDAVGKEYRTEILDMLRIKPKQKVAKKR